MATLQNYQQSVAYLTQELTGFNKNSPSSLTSTELNDIEIKVRKQIKILEEVTAEVKKQKENRIKENRKIEFKDKVYRWTFKVGAVLCIAGAATTAIYDTMQHKIAGLVLVVFGTAVSTVSNYIYNDISMPPEVTELWASHDADWSTKARELHDFLIRYQVIKQKASSEDTSIPKSEDNKTPLQETEQTDIKALNQFIQSYLKTFTEIKILSEDGREFVAKKLYDPETYSSVVCIAARSLPTTHPIRKKMERLEEISNSRSKLDTVKDYGVGSSSSIEWTAESGAYGTGVPFTSEPIVSHEQYAKLFEECTRDLTREFNLPEDKPITIIETATKKLCRNSFIPTTPTEAAATSVTIHTSPIAPELPVVSLSSTPTKTSQSLASSSSASDKSMLINSNNGTNKTVPSLATSAITESTSATNTPAVVISISSPTTDFTMNVNPEEIAVTTA